VIALLVPWLAAHALELGALAALWLGWWIVADALDAAGRGGGS
jgi:hypothetical protein